MHLIKSYCKTLAQALLFWLLFFGLQRGIFLFYHAPLTFKSSFFDILFSFIVGFKLDFTAACYILTIQGLIILFGLISGWKFFEKFNAVVWWIGLILSSIIATIDFELFSSWNAKLNYKVMQYIGEPVAIVSFVSMNKIIFLTILCIAMIFMGYYLRSYIQKRFFAHKDNRKSSWKEKVVLLIGWLFIQVVLILGIRGGWQEIPINPSSITVTRNYALNNAAVNSSWNLLYTFIENRNNLKTNPYKVLPDGHADRIVKDLFSRSKDTTVSIFNFKNNKPNIVFILMEGVNANVLAHHNLNRSYAPFLDSILLQSYYFERSYSTGFRTDQGVPAVLSGYPSQPYTSIVTQTNKVIQLPCIVSSFKKQGYEAQFVYGGESEFDNMKNYLVHNKFDYIIDVKDFDRNIITQKLGVSDKHVFDKMLEMNKGRKKPLLSMILTQSTHEPYDIVENKMVFDESKRYLNAVRYLDRCLGDFFHRAKREPWFANTVFIISSDHAHLHPNNYSPSEVERFHTPMLIYSPLLKPGYIGYRDSAVFNQTDIPSTLFHQLHWKSNQFEWSKNHFNPYQKKFAFCTYVNGHLFIEDSISAGYEYRFMRPSSVPKGMEHPTQKGWAILQKVMDQYLAY
ncbi:MAG: sulfatase-like hydrolase/transferase [Bacteroidetes bacterium]|nr:sulfatase-like hydrolase/transferase [Bacteroidota bacterium]